MFVKRTQVSLSSEDLRFAKMSHNAQLQPSATYANVVEQEKCPTKEQAIILDSIDGFTIEEYCVAIGTEVEPINVRYIYRISQRRICIYLSSSELAEKLVHDVKTVQIKDQLLEIRPLYTKSKRILISSVQPLISATVIEKELTTRGITPMSKITQIKATSVTTTGFSHLMSFRRQVYIQPKDVSKLPESLKINYDDMACWIYFSTDKLICFICKEEGHTQKYCQNTTTQNTEKELAAAQENNRLDNSDTSEISVKQVNTTEALNSEQ